LEIAIFSPLLVAARHGALRFGSSSSHAVAIVPTATRLGRKRLVLISDRGIVMSVQLSGNQSKGIIRAGALRRLAAALFTVGALVGVIAGGASAKTVSLTCRGSGSSCSTTIGLAGGASNKKLKIALSDTNLKLVGISAKPSIVREAYSLSKGSYSLGGSVYTVTLNAVQSIPKGSTLTLRFSSHGKAIKVHR
jgi:hypothetical protein